MNYEFEIEEVKRDGYIAWDAIEPSTGKRFPINTDGYLVAGRFPEIEQYIKDTYGKELKVEYSTADSDSLNGNTWVFNRGEDTVTINDIPRTVFRISGFST